MNWNRDNAKLFVININRMKLDKLRENLNEALEDHTLSLENSKRKIDLCILEITHLMRESALASGIEKESVIKNNIKRKKPNNRWFHQDCKDLGKEFNEKRNKHRNSHLVEDGEEAKLAGKYYKREVNKQFRKYQKEINIE